MGSNVQQEKVMNIELLGSILESGGVVLASLITGLCLFLSAKRITSRDKLTKDLKVAFNDILVFNAIEAELLQRSGMSKAALREFMREQSMELSGKHSPSVIRRKLKQLD
jgi:hypothetical protein